MRNHMLQVNINSRDSHWEILYIWQSCFVLLLLENQVRAFSILETFFKAAWCLFIRVVSVLALERLLQKTTDKKLRYWLHECLQALLVVSPQQPGHSELAPATSMAPPSLWIRSLSNFSGSFFEFVAFYSGATYLIPLQGISFVGGLGLGRVVGWWGEEKEQ
jgi:hypothetical protein